MSSSALHHVFYAYSEQSTPLATTAYPDGQTSLGFKNSKRIQHVLSGRPTITLVDGSCTGAKTNQSYLTDTPFPMDALPVLVHSLGQWIDNKNDSSWFYPVYVTSVANTYWARPAFMLPSANSDDDQPNSEVHYPPKDERVVSTRVTMNVNWLLYFVLALQPALTFIMFVWALLYYEAPIGRGFGLVAILAGMKKIARMC